MENRIVKFRSKESGTLNLHAIPGHFATTHSHINYYVDVTSIKTRASEAKEAAKILQTKMPRGAYIDTIVCMDGTQMIGAFLSEEIEKEKAKIDSKYLFKRKKMQEKYDEMFEQKKQELDSEKEKQISLIKEKYEQEKGKILETVLNNIII